VIDGVSIACEAGQITALIGPNGAGKSTALKAIGGVIPLMAGSVVIEGADVSRLPVERRVRHGLVYVPQIEDVFPSLTVAENLEMRTYLTHRARRSVRKDLSDVLSLFPALATSWKRKAGTLSGGQRKMLAMAGALSAGPRVMLLDEPTAGLAPRFVDEVWDCIRQTARSGIAVLIVDQNVPAALSHADQVYVLIGGRVDLSGPPDLVAQQDLSGMFLGKGVDSEVR
jgi:branched-chain amino acid transport system ATP-binding protein